MSSKEAYERCPRPSSSWNYEKYKSCGTQNLELFFKRYTDLIEPMSIDEAYLMWQKTKLGIKSAVKIARLIQRISGKNSINCFCRCFHNKFLAKMAMIIKTTWFDSILPEQAEDFSNKWIFPSFMVEKKDSGKTSSNGCFYWSWPTWSSWSDPNRPLWQTGLWPVSKGSWHPQFPVKSNRIRKSIGKEKTYGKILRAEEDIKRADSSIRKSRSQSQSTRKAGKIVILKIRYEDFSTLTNEKVWLKKHRMLAR